jgi:hypothetical protein
MFKSSFKETTFPKGAKARRICDAPVPDGLIDPSFKETTFPKVH